MADSLNTPTLPENRTDLEALIEAAIARLDDLEPDPDLEDDDDGEPQLGAPEARAGSWNGLYPVAFTDDREGDDSDDEDGGDDEPALASTAMQDRYNRHTMQDGDLELDESDREPSLASTNSLDQRKWWYGRNDDAEHEHDGLEPVCEDEGAACEDEGAFDSDFADDEDDPRFSGPFKTQVESGRDAQACARMIEGLRTLQRGRGEMPVPTLRLVGGLVMR